MKVQILGTRGIPAKHGGFETFAEDLSLFLVRNGHEVTVYCQSNRACKITTERWSGVELVHVYGGEGAKGTVRFDYHCAREALRRQGVILTLGYNTAILSLMYRFSGRVSVMNMDGIEWRRDKWSFVPIACGGVSRGKCSGGA